MDDGTGFRRIHLLIVLILLSVCWMAAAVCPAAAQDSELTASAEDRELSRDQDQDQDRELSRALSILDLGPVTKLTPGDDYRYLVTRLVQKGRREEALIMARTVDNPRLRNGVVWSLLEELTVVGDCDRFITVLVENMNTQCVRDLLLENVYLKFFLKRLYLLDLPGLFLRSRPADLIEITRRFTEEGAYTAQAHFMTGFLHRQTGRFDLSIESFNQALAIDETFALAHFFLALSRIETGDFEASLEAVRRAISLEPGNDDFLDIVPALQMVTWHFEEAGESYRADGDHTGLVWVALAQFDIEQLFKLINGKYGAQAKGLALSIVMFLGFIPFLLGTGYLLASRRQNRVQGLSLYSWPSLLLLSALLLGITMVVFVIVSLVMYRSPYAFMFPKLFLRVFLVSYLVTAVLWPVIVLGFAFKRKRESKKGETQALLRLKISHLAAGAFFGTILYGLTWVMDLIVPHIQRYLPDVLIQTRVEELIMRSLIGSGDFVLLVVVVVIAAPLLEETFFRGVLQGTVERSLGTAVAIVLSSGIFAVVHMRAILQMFIMGLVLAWLFHRSRNLAVPIVAHAVSNGLTILVALSSSAVL